MAYLLFEKNKISLTDEFEQPYLKNVYSVIFDDQNWNKKTISAFNGGIINLTSYAHSVNDKTPISIVFKESFFLGPFYNNRDTQLLTIFKTLISNFPTGISELVISTGFLLDDCFPSFIADLAFLINHIKKDLYIYFLPDLSLKTTEKDMLQLKAKYLHLIDKSLFILASKTMGTVTITLAENKKSFISDDEITKQVDAIRKRFKDNYEVQKKN